MAPMESAKAEGGLSRDELEKALASCGLDELHEMSGRLSKGMDQFQEMLEDLQVEQTVLKEENGQLNETISMMMKEMQKLHIGSDNTVEPRLQEGPLDFVGRFWEKVKPRNSGIVVSEHVGEIKKPGEDPENERLQQIQEQGKQVAQKLASKIGPIWQRAETLVKDAKGEIAKQVAERKRQQQKAQRAAAKEGRKRAEKVSSTGEATANAEPEVARSAAAASSDAGAPSFTGPPVEAEEPAPAAAPAPAPAAAAPAAAPADPAPAEAQAKAEAPEEEISSTILIEATIKIDDGSTHTLLVRAADRCKEVSKRFVQEHSLKAWFEEPLTAWLKKVESDAEKFPVKVEADIMELRKLHSKSK